MKTKIVSVLLLSMGLLAGSAYCGDRHRDQNLGYDGRNDGGIPSIRFGSDRYEHTNRYSNRGSNSYDQFGKVTDNRHSTSTHRNYDAMNDGRQYRQDWRE